MLHGFQRHVTSAEDRVSWPQLIAYGMGGLVPVALFNIAGQLMGLLGNISLGLSAFWLGVVMIIPRLWDAVSDPVVGHLSDNTRTRWGRRRPYILCGGIAVALSFVAMWWVPRGEWIRELLPSEAAFNWFQLGYILCGLLVFFTACTVFEIPHGALGMELSSDYHERTRLFSAKSFLGNLFAMGTPWLLFLAGLEFFRGNGDLADGMRYVSMFIAAALLPLAIWWFLSLREPPLIGASEQRKSKFWRDMKITTKNRTFIRLVLIIFTLAMGFNFVSLFNYYITIFYIYGGDAVEAGTLLGINGTVWAVTGLVAVFPLNWLSRRMGKNRTLVLAILLMCAAQLTKIVCYDPDRPYLALIPTVLLSAGMLMFFTLGSSMVADVCDEDELDTGRRAEGSYYSVYWWFIKMGTAFASFVTGALLVFTFFDETQNVTVDSLRGNLEAVEAAVERTRAEPPSALSAVVEKEVSQAIAASGRLEAHWRNRGETAAAESERSGSLVDRLATGFESIRRSNTSHAEHSRRLLERLETIRAELDAFYEDRAALATDPPQLLASIETLLNDSLLLKRQSASTLLRLRIIEIGLPLLLSCVSIWLTLGYPLTEARSYEIKEELKQRRAARAS